MSTNVKATIENFMRFANDVWPSYERFATLSTLRQSVLSDEPLRTGGDNHNLSKLDKRSDYAYRQKLVMMIINSLEDEYQTVIKLTLSGFKKTEMMERLKIYSLPTFNKRQRDAILAFVELFDEVFKEYDDIAALHVNYR